MKLLLLLLLFWFYTLNVAFGQCAYQQLSLAQRFQDSDWVVEAITYSEPSLKIENRIYTPFQIKFLKIYKSPGLELEKKLYIHGGQIGLEIEIMTPNLNLELGTIKNHGVYFLKESNFSKNILFPVANFQSLLSIEQDSVYDPANPNKSITAEQLHTELLELSHKYTYLYLNKLPVNKFNTNKENKDVAFATYINNFIPTKITSGTREILTINGSGFGSLSGSANIAFPNSDNGGSTYINVPNSEIISWTDTQIRLRVPSRAGTGRFRVTTSSGSIANSPFNLIIPYSVLSYAQVQGSSLFPAYWYNQNSIGGLTFSINQNFFNNSSAVSAFSRALENWRCSIGVNASIANTTTPVNCSMDDNTNVITFDESCSNGAGILAVTFSRIQGCLLSNGEINWHVKDVDIIFSRNFNWNFGPNATNGGKFDFESVALHELGHAIQLSHVIDPTKVMFFSVSANSDKRLLNINSEVAGGNWLVNNSGVSSCNRPAHVKLISSNCRLTGKTTAPPVIANFSTNLTTGCASLTVRFSDLSTGFPTQWKWDIDNDGIVDYTNQNPTHTYSKPGIYTVKLTVNNSANANTVTRIGLITVTQGNVVASISPQRLEACIGSSVTLYAAGAESYSWATNQGQTGSGNRFTFILKETTLITLTGMRNGCSSIASTSVKALPLPSINVRTTNPTFQNNGSIVATASKTSSPYTFNINNGAYSNNSNFLNLASGTYKIGVKDAKGCINTTMVTLTGSNVPESCSIPQDLRLSNITQGSANISWQNVVGAVSYTLAYRLINQNWIERNIGNSPNYLLSEILSNTSYEIRIRANCNNNVLSDFSSPISFTTLSNDSPNTTCTQPTLTISNTTATTAQFTWNPIVGATSYELYYRISPTGAWSINTINALNFLATNLIPNTSYEVYIRSHCQNTPSSFAGPFSMKTSEKVYNCSALGNISAVTHYNFATIHWAPVLHATGYRISWKLSNTTAWSSVDINANGSTLSIFSLYPATTYDYQVQALCGTSISNISDLHKFTTLASKDDMQNSIIADEDEIIIYPNPVSDKLSVNFRTLNKSLPCYIKIYDLKSGLIHQQELDQSSTIIDVSAFSSGLYICEVCINNNFLHKKIIIR